MMSQQGELDAVQMYQRLAKVVKTEKDREIWWYNGDNNFRT